MGSVIGALLLLTGVSSTILARSRSDAATLSRLTLSNVEFGTFASGTTSYTASVTYSVEQTTVTPTVNQSGARYVIKLRGEWRLSQEWSGKDLFQLNEEVSLYEA